MADFEFTWRPADHSDNGRLNEIFKSVSMKADLHLTVERDPNFFALYDIQQCEQFVKAICLNGTTEGCCSILTRDGFIDGALVKTGYIGDMRFMPAMQGKGFMNQYYGQAFAEIVQESSVDCFLTAVIRSNKAALAALVKRSDKFPDKPVYTPLRNFRIESVQFTTRKKPRPSDFTVRTATSDDIDQIVTFFGNDQQHRPFGYVFDRDLLQFRLAHWPEFRIENFYLAFDDNTLVGMTAPWDAYSLKRFRVLGYHNTMRWMKIGYNAAAKLTGFEPLPQVGQTFRYFYLTHTSIPSENPDIMAALVDRVYADYYGKGFHFFTLYVDENDPLKPAIDRFRRTGLPATLYTVSPPDTEWATTDFGPGRIGFEMALV